MEDDESHHLQWKEILRLPFGMACAISMFIGRQSSQRLQPEQGLPNLSRQTLTGVLQSKRSAPVTSTGMEEKGKKSQRAAQTRPTTAVSACMWPVSCGVTDEWPTGLKSKMSALFMSTPLFHPCRSSWPMEQECHALRFPHVAAVMVLTYGRGTRNWYIYDHAARVSWPSPMDGRLPTSIRPR